MADPEREFDAVVIGSSERAFYGNQFAAMAPLFEHYNVQVWVPELGGAVDPRVVGQEELMILLGMLSKREIARARIRVRAAMTVQARDQGRYLGGRPPYGYRLVDAGPHPNRTDRPCPETGPRGANLCPSELRADDTLVVARGGMWM
jgi:site-specific DNA recombinase